MKKCTLLPLTVLLLLFHAAGLSAAPRFYSVSGKVTDAADGAPLAGAVVHVDALWAISDEQGRYRLERVPEGKGTMAVSLLGYQAASLQIDLRRNEEDLSFRLQRTSLAIEGVTVTAKRPANGLGTSHDIGREALDHLQLSAITDMSALLPGGKTSNPDLTQAGVFSMRSGGLSAGNAAFATALEVDGVRLGGNASFAEPDGVDTRNIQVENVDHVEVLSGVLSAEYGDLGSGMVRIHTKKGRTPFTFTASTNPRTRQVSVSKGVGLGPGAGVLNIGAEWARAVKKAISPYESYTRRGLSLSYTAAPRSDLHLEAGLSGNLGGMDSKDDPDAYSGEYSRGRDNVLRARTSLEWQAHRPFLTRLGLEASVGYNDRLTRVHAYDSWSVPLPAVHAEEAGYHLASILPASYFSDKVTDSRELDYAAALKYGWDLSQGGWKSHFKAGAQWKAEGNAGRGEYYEDPTYAADGYRPRPYSDYPFMHNLALYAEERFLTPFGLEASAGLRMENVFVKGSPYSDVHSFSPRFNAKWTLRKGLALRGGWGVSEKLPSFHVLYPLQEYRDLLSVGFSHGSSASYIYYTIPYTLLVNPALKWQRSENAELGLDFDAGGFSLSAVAFLNRTLHPYRYDNAYTPFSYRIYDAPTGAADPPVIALDATTGAVSVDGTPLTLHVEDKTFVLARQPANGAPVTRYGTELTVDFPRIRPIRTSFRLDASWTHSAYDDHGRFYSYNDNWSHPNPALPDRSYPYVGIYENGGGGSMMVSGVNSDRLDANLTSVTHITQARLIVTCRLEVSLLRRSRNIPAGGTTELWPVAYMDLDGVVHPFTATEAAQDEFRNLIKYPSNDYLFLQDGYAPYASANLSLTKEIGDHVSLSFYANNFTNARPYVVSRATGVGAVFTPAFYYGLSCRIKL
ncbi:MAG: TonB-dependent receptor [Bacteroidales bacterium]|nr:TonB-dependent receptor [Bacteroidales bacterium]